MSDFSTGSFSFDGTDFALTSAGDGSVGTYQPPVASIVPFNPQTSNPGGTTFSDGISGAVSSIFHSFTNGISTVVNGAAQGAAAYLGGGGQVVGYDRYGQPIYSMVDPVSGARYTSSSAAWPGAPGNPSNYPERTPPNYQTGGVFGWLTNLLSLPAPKPTPLIGAVGSQPAAGPINAPIVSGISGAQIVMAMAAAGVAYVAFKAVVK